MKLQEIYNKNKKNILMGVSLGGLILISYSWFKAGLKISKILEEKQEEMDLVDQNDKEAMQAVTIETVKKVVPKTVIPTLVTIGTGAAIIYTNRESAKELATLSAAYMLTKNNLTDTKNKMKEILGEKKTRQIEDAVTKDRFQRSPIVKDGLVVTNAQNGTVLCKDEYTGRFFYSSAEKINLAISRISTRFIHEDFVSINDFYELLGLDYVKMGSRLGWRAQDFNGEIIPIHFSTLLTDDDTPCLVVEFDVSVRDRWGD